MWTRTLVAIALAGFLALTARALSHYSYVGFLEAVTANAVVSVLFFDLVICLSLIAVWIYRDARRLGITPWPYIAIGASFGVAGPLAYLLRRPRRGGPFEDVPRAAPRVLLPVLVLFTAATLFAIYRYGYASFVFFAVANEATQLLFVDLSLSLILIAIWMVWDARAHKGAYLPFVALAFFFGSVGPLAYLLTRGWGRVRQRLVGAIAVAAGALAMTLGSGHADLRSQTARRSDTETERRGRERLARLAERHGYGAWKLRTTMETVARDFWPGGGPWWPEGDQRFRTQALLGTFTSRAELLDGSGAGEIWGLQAWAPYKERNRERTWVPKSEGALTFYLPTLHYFNELPFRILSAPVVRDGGDVRHYGRSYDLVFATWRAPEPQPDLDQYVLWIDRETGLLSKVRYTVRDAVPRMSPLMQKLALPLVAGTMHYEDYRDIDGIQVPFLQTVTLQPPELTRYPLSENYFHRLELEEARFDTVPRETLLPDPAKGDPGDRKPEID
jgi:hypothetical protein